MARIAAIGMIAATVGIVVGCHDSSAVASKSVAVPPSAISVAPTVVASSTVARTIEVVHQTESAAARAVDAAGPSASNQPTEDLAEGDGCVSSVAELPPSPLYDADDPRLRASALIVAHKSARRLMLFSQGVQQQCVPMGLGFSPEGHKQREGDGRTPEGWYRTSDKPWSAFDGAIAIHYPNREDAKAARSDGRLSRDQYGRVMGSLRRDHVPPQQTPMGGEVLIHGGGSGSDWTFGCMALDDRNLARLRAALPTDKRVSLLVLP